MSSTGVPYGSAPPPDESYLSRGYGGNSDSLHDSTINNHIKNAEHLAAAGLGRSPSNAPPSAAATTPSRSGTLRKKGSVRRTGSLRRSSSRRSIAAGSIKGLGGPDFDSRDFNSAFYTPIPTQGSPTDVLADRFQAWRQLLKSLITYFREIQASYETRAKAIHKVQNTLANIAHPTILNAHDGLSDASRILEDYHKHSLAEAAKSRGIEEDVIAALSGLRNDLGTKIKEIKSLSGDFKNSVEKEQDATRREVDKLQEALQNTNSGVTGKSDPFVVRLGVDRAVERQIDEENYLHRAYLNLESSGRELESIVVGEIQKAYNALAGILKREGDENYNAVELLRTGPIALPKDFEWMNFVVSDQHFVDPNVPLRRIEDIQYPGKHDPSAAEVRAGMLERKSKYLKSYSPGWYVLSPTHLHEFKSADKIYSQPPVMSLYLPDQRLGSKSEMDSSSHKFMLKGKQSGSMHKGHNWVFRAESHETMMAWYEAILVLTEKSAPEREAFVRQHARNLSGDHDRRTISSDGFEEDEADATPFSGDVASLAENNPVQERPPRPQPGGRFPSDMRLPTTNTLVGPPSEDSDSVVPSDVAVAAAPLVGVGRHDHADDPYRLEGIASHTRSTSDVPKDASPNSYDNYYSSTGQSNYASAPAQPAKDLASEIPQQHPEGVLATSTSPAQNYEPAPTTDAFSSMPNTSNTTTEPLTSGWTHPALVGGAAGVAGGLAANAAAEHAHHPDEAPPEPSNVRTEPLPSTAAHTSFVAPVPVGDVLGSSGVASGGVADAPSGTTTTASGLSSATGLTEEPAIMAGSDKPDANSLGGLEKEGARVTGRVFPVIRHDTNMSISGLHVPGQFPPQK